MMVTVKHTHADVSNYRVVSCQRIVHSV